MAVQTMKNLMKKRFESGDDVYLALLDLRNTPRNEQIGSPMQRLMGRLAKTLLAISDGLRKPTTVQPETVSSKLIEYRQKQKSYYDRGAKERAQCQPSDTLRIHIPDGWKPAEFVSKSEAPRSYLVKAGSDRLYRRNNSMLIRTKEEPHEISTQESDIPPMNIPVCARPKTEMTNTRVVQKQSASPTKSSAESEVIQRTKSGREIKKPKYLENYSTT